MNSSFVDWSPSHLDSHLIDFSNLEVGSFILKVQVEHGKFTWILAKLAIKQHILQIDVILKKYVGFREPMIIFLTSAKKENILLLFCHYYFYPLYWQILFVKTRYLFFLVISNLLVLKVWMVQIFTLSRRWFVHWPMTL